MDDAAKRAEAFNAEERFGELESENARLRAELARVIAQFRAVLDRDKEIIAEVTRVLAMPPDAQQGFADAQATMRACLDLAETVLTPSPKERAEILPQMRDDAAATGLDQQPR